MPQLAETLGTIEHWARESYNISIVSDDSLVPVIARAFEAMSFVLKAPGKRQIQRALESLESERSISLRHEQPEDSSVRSLMYAVVDCLQQTLFHVTENRNEKKPSEELSTQTDLVSNHVTGASTALLNENTLIIPVESQVPPYTMPPLDFMGGEMELSVKQEDMADYDMNAGMDNTSLFALSIKEEDMMDFDMNQEMKDTALTHDMPLNDLANDEMFSGVVDPSFNEDNTLNDISSSVEVIDCGLSIDSRNGDDEFMNPVMGDADTRVERSINEPSFVIRDSANTPIFELGDANLDVETMDDPYLIDRELAHRLYPDSAFMNASMEFNEKMAAFRANDSNNDSPPRVEEVGSGDGHDETMANELIGREGDSERTNGNVKDQVNEGRRSSRVASRAQQHKHSEGEDEPAKKKPRSEAEKVRNSSSKSSSQSKSLLRQAIKVTHKCVRCETYPQTIDRYVKHLRNAHRSTLSANGIYLKCACGLQVHHEVLSHSKRCDGRHFTVHKVDED